MLNNDVAIVPPLEDWEILPLINGWEGYNTGVRNLRVRVDAFGMVHLGGFLKNGTATAIAALPLRFRPSVSEISLPSICDPGSGSITVSRIFIANGFIYSGHTNVSWMSLEGAAYWLS